MFHRSERLLLRPGWIEDAAELTAGIAHEEIVRNLATAPWPYRVSDASEWLMQPNDPRMPAFLVTLPNGEGSRIVGGCGMQAGRQGPEIGYWIARDCWGRGYATEATRAVLSIARTLGHRRVFARHAADNPASGKVLRKAGFRPTGSIGTYYSRGRGAEVTSPEYVAELGECAGDNDPSVMPQAA